MPNQNDYFYEPHPPPGIEAGEGRFPPELRDLRGPEGAEQFSIHDYQEDPDDPDSRYFMVVPPSGDPGAPMSDSQQEMGERFKTEGEAREYMQMIMDRREDFERVYNMQLEDLKRNESDYIPNFGDFVLSSLHESKSDAKPGENWEDIVNVAAGIDIGRNLDARREESRRLMEQGEKAGARRNIPESLEVPGTMNVVTGELTDGDESRFVPGFDYGKPARPQFQSAFGTFPAGKGLLENR